MAWTVTVITQTADTGNNTTFDLADTNLTFTLGKTYLVGCVNGDAAPEEDPTGIATTDATLTFTKIASRGYNVAASAAQVITWWYGKPVSTITGKTLRVTLNDAGTGVVAVLLSIDESTATPPHVAGNSTGNTATASTTTVTATPGALQAATSLQLVLGAAQDTVAQTISGTNWTEIAAQSITSPNIRMKIGKNDSGTAAAATYSHASNLVERGILLIEIAAGTPSTSIAAISSYYNQMMRNSDG